MVASFVPRRFDYQVSGTWHRPELQPESLNSPSSILLKESRQTSFIAFNSPRAERVLRPHRTVQTKVRRPPLSPACRRHPLTSVSKLASRRHPIAPPQSGYSMGFLAT